MILLGKIFEYHSKPHTQHPTMHHKKIILPILMASMFMNGLLMNGVVVILGNISTSMNLDA
ncbi:MAG TPA: hypothetical protein VFC41_02280, partial [Anaerovoracaceae bacterium]|nr:hypothetical protein [Anaerovoracaceae bacterium]